MHPALSPKPSALLAGACALGVLGGCNVTIKDGDIKDVSIHAKVTQEWSRQYPLAAGGRVEIVNPDGPIDAVVGPAGSVDVAVVLDAGAMTETRAKEVLTEFKMEESATSDHIRVSTARTRGRRGVGDVDISYKVTLPADARLEMTGTNGTITAGGLRGHVKAMVVNGGVELTAMTGTVDVASVNGSLRVKMAQVTGPLRLEATNGRIALELPKSAKATLNARAVNGGINITGLTIGEGTGRRIRTLESQLNGGGPEIDLRVTNGRINIDGVETPTSPTNPTSQKSRPIPPTPPTPPRP